MKTKLLISSLFSVFCLSSFAQTTVTLQASKDALLHGLSSEANVNYGSTPQFCANAWTFNGTEAFVRSIMYFDLSAIPSSAIINSAELSLYAWGSTTGMGEHSTLSGGNECWLQRVSSTWDEMIVTWNTQPSAVIANQVSMAASTSPAQNYLNINVASLVQDMINDPLNSFGFMLKLQNEQAYRRMNFAAREHTNSLVHPKLVINYTDVTGVKNNDPDYKVSIYPNPFKTATVFNFKNPKNEPHNLTIYNTMGQLVLHVGSITGNQALVERNNLDSGIYFYQLQNKEGQLVNAGKLILE